MQPVDEAQAVQNLGLKGDRHALPDSPRQVLLLEAETLDLLGLSAGELKENITTRGVDLNGLRTGDRLAIGPYVVLEITKPCSPCSRMEEIRPGLQQEVAGRRGTLARVLIGGTIRRDDPVTVSRAR